MFVGAEIGRQQSTHHHKLFPVLIHVHYLPWLATIADGGIRGHVSLDFWCRRVRLACFMFLIDIDLPQRGFTS